MDAIQPSWVWEEWCSTDLNPVSLGLNPPKNKQNNTVQSLYHMFWLYAHSKGRTEAQKRSCIRRMAAWDPKAALVPGSKTCQVGRFALAKEACDFALELGWSAKGWLRRAQAHLGRGLVWRGWAWGVWGARGLGVAGKFCYFFVYCRFFGVLVERFLR